MENANITVERAIVTFAANSTLSSVASLDQKALVGIAMDSSWTTADITFLISIDGATFLNVFERDGLEYAAASPSAGTYVVLPPADMPSVANIKIRSGTSASPVAQDSTRTMTLLSRTV